MITQLTRSSCALLITVLFCQWAVWSLEETETVTQFVTPPYLKSVISDLEKIKPTHTTGIPLVIVYESAYCGDENHDVIDKINDVTEEKIINGPVENVIDDDIPTTLTITEYVTAAKTEDVTITNTPVVTITKAAVVDRTVTHSLQTSIAPEHYVGHNCVSTKLVVQKGFAIGETLKTTSDCACRGCALAPSKTHYETDFQIIVARTISVAVTFDTETSSIASKVNRGLTYRTIEGTSTIEANQWSFQTTAYTSVETVPLLDTKSASVTASVATTHLDASEEKDYTPVNTKSFPTYENTTKISDSGSRERNNTLPETSLEPNLSSRNETSPSAGQIEQSSLNETTSSDTTIEVSIIKDDPECNVVSNLFELISEVSPSQFYTERAHPLVLPEGVSNDKPYQTNKFYSNLFLGSQTQTAFTFPYEVFWEKTSYHGLGIQRSDANRRVFGPMDENGASRYFFNPIFLGDIYVGANEITKENNHMKVSDMRSLSAQVQLSPTTNGDDYIEFPLVEGMGFITAIYHGRLTMTLKSISGIKDLILETITPQKPDLLVYRVTIGSGDNWLIYITLPKGETDFTLKAENDVLKGSKSVDGLIVQIAFAPQDAKKESYYYEAAGKYATGAEVTGSSQCSLATYTISYNLKGESISGSTLIFALPHHVESLDPKIKELFTGISMESTTKGTMLGFLTDRLVLNENLDLNVQWTPYIRDKNTDLRYTKEQIELIRQTAVKELEGVDIVASVLAIDSTYFMGKAIDKYANMLFVLWDLVKDVEMAEKVLEALKTILAKYKNGEAIQTLFYDYKFGGVTSQAAFKNPLEDFGSGYYNDHQFHYSYLIHAAAIVGLIDNSFGGSWIKNNQEWINTLVRDVANPSDDDVYFPVSRSFDWFHGHSWAKGLFESGDGKDQESTSEDVHFSYAMKLWGKVTNNKAMEARGDLMLQIQKRSFNSYFLFGETNEIVPEQIRKNMVGGIVFENKVDYATYFGARPEYIHGIQMIPMTPALGMVRDSKFAELEWDRIISKIDDVDKGWNGILRANQVLFDPKAAYEFFADPKFDYAKLDGGQSRTYCLAWSAPFANQEVKKI